METELVGGADLVLLAVIVRLGFWLVGTFRAWRTEQANGGFAYDVRLPAPVPLPPESDPDAPDRRPETNYRPPPPLTGWADEERERQAKGRGWLPAPDVEGREWRYGQRQ